MTVSKNPSSLGADCDLIKAVNDANAGPMADTYVLKAVDDRICSLFTHGDVVVTGCVTIERVITQGCIFEARRVAFQGVITERFIFGAVHIIQERVTAKGIVEGCRAIAS